MSGGQLAVPDDLVEAAARIGYDDWRSGWPSTYRCSRWDNITEAQRESVRQTVRAQLDVVVPLLRVSIANQIEPMCDWRFDADNQHDYSEQHRAYHFGRWPGQTGVCPYAAMAQVVRGNPDPRRESAGVEAE